MKRRTIAALLACTMVIGTLAGCSSEPKNPGDNGGRDNGSCTDRTESI